MQWISGHRYLIDDRLLLDQLSCCRRLKSFTWEKQSFSNAQFDQYFDNQNNNVITFRDKNYANAAMLEIPEREDQGIAEYVFEANLAS